MRTREGFTLIELMVVVLIIAILIAIAIPTFLGAQDRAKDRAAQSDLRNALTAAKTIATDFEGSWCSATSATAGECTAIDAGDLYAEEASLTFVDTVTPSGGSSAVAVTVHSFTGASSRRQPAGPHQACSSEQVGQDVRPHRHQRRRSQVLHDDGAGGRNAVPRRQVVIDLIS